MTTFKVTLISSTSLAQTKKISLQSPNYTTLAATLSARFNLESLRLSSLSYTDEEGDAITISTDEDLQELLASHVLSRSPIRLTLSLIQDFEVVRSAPAKSYLPALFDTGSASTASRGIVAEEKENEDGAFSDVGSNWDSGSEGTEYQLLEYPSPGSLTPAEELVAAVAGGEVAGEREENGKEEELAVDEFGPKDLVGLEKAGGNAAAPSTLEEFVESYDPLKIAEQPTAPAPVFLSPLEPTATSSPDPSEAALPQAPTASSASDPAEVPLRDDSTGIPTLDKIIETVNFRFQGVRDHLAQTLFHDMNDDDVPQTTPSTDDPADEALPSSNHSSPTTEIPTLASLFESLNGHLEGIRVNVTGSLSGLAGHFATLSRTPADELPAVVLSVGAEMKTVLKDVVTDIRKEAEEVREEVKKFKTCVEEARRASTEEERVHDPWAGIIKREKSKERKEKEEAEPTSPKDAGASENRGVKIVEESRPGLKSAHSKEMRRTRRDERAARRGAQYTCKPDNLNAANTSLESVDQGVAAIPHPTTPPINWIPLVPGRFPESNVATAPPAASTTAETTPSSHRHHHHRIPSDRRKPIGPREMRWTATSPASVPSLPSVPGAFDLPEPSFPPLASTSDQRHSVDTALAQFRRAVFDLGFDSRDLVTQIVIERVWKAHRGETVDVLVAHAVQQLCA